MLAKVLLDDLALHGDPQAAVDRRGGLRQDGEVRGPTAASHRSSSAVEQRELDAKLVANLRGVLLSLVQRPGGGHAARVFTGIGVPDHDLLVAVDEVVVPRNREEPSELVRPLDQVIEPLEQRRHAEELIDLTPHLALEEHDGEDVGCDGGHGDDVRPE